jgi:hypothetical protein
MARAVSSAIGVVIFLTGLALFAISDVDCREDKWSSYRRGLPAHVIIKEHYPWFGLMAGASLVVYSRAVGKGGGDAGH